MSGADEIRAAITDVLCGWMDDQVAIATIESSTAALMDRVIEPWTRDLEGLRDDLRRQLEAELDAMRRDRNAQLKYGTNEHQRADRAEEHVREVTAAYEIAMQQRDEARAAIARVRAEHSPDSDGNCVGCGADGHENPIPISECRTLAALDGTGGGA